MHRDVVPHVPKVMRDQNFFTDSEDIPVAEFDWLRCVKRILFLDGPVRRTHIVDL